MDLLEYQAKKLFAQVDIPVLPSQSIFTASDLKNLQIPYPVVLKSQVLSSERNKFGAVRFVENTIDAIAVAQSLFNLPIKGEYPEALLAETRYDAENELFLGVIVDYTLKKPVLLGSAYGGVDLEQLLKNLQTCVIQEEFSPFYARHLTTLMGFQGKAIAPIADIVEKMYHLLINYDLDLVEINPLGINRNGEVMALDGKVRINDYALNRHPALLSSLNLNVNLNSSLDNQPEDHNLCLIQKEFYRSLDLDSNSNLAVITDNIDETIFLINALKNNQKTIHTCYVLPKKNKLFWMNNIYSLFLEIIKSQPINQVFVNHSNQDQMLDILQEKIVSYYDRQSQQNSIPSQERAERPTGVRDRINTKNQLEKSGSSVRNIQWIIRDLSFPDQNNLTENIPDNQPIYLISSLNQVISLLTK